jgi:hypothetical protein
MDPRLREDDRGARERRPRLKIVIPAHAGIHFQPGPGITWILAFARMTEGQENVVRRL